MWSKVLVFLFLITLSFAQNTGINTGTSFYALRFPDTGQASVSLPESLSSDLPYSFSFEAWVMLPGTVGSTKVTTADGLYKTVVSRYAVRPDGTYHNRYADFDFQIQKTGDINFFMGSGLSPNFYGVIITAGILEAGKWTHLAFSVFTPSGSLNPSYATVYVDGVPHNGTWKTGDRQLREDVPIHLGAYLNQDGDVKWWRGYLDEIRFWSVYRSTDQVQSTMHIGIDSDSPDLLAYYKCDSGSLLIDSTGHYDGQFMSGAGTIEYELSGAKLGLSVSVSRQAKLQIELPGTGTSSFTYVIETIPDPSVGRLSVGGTYIFSDNIPFSLPSDVVTFEAANVHGVSTKFSYYGKNGQGREPNSTWVQVHVDESSCVPDACGVCNGDNSTCTCLQAPYKGYDQDELERLLFLYEIEESLNLLNQIEIRLEQSSDGLDSNKGANLDDEISKVQDFREACLETFSEQLGDFLEETARVEA